MIKETSEKKCDFKGIIVPKKQNFYKEESGYGVYWVQIERIDYVSDEVLSLSPKQMSVKLHDRVTITGQTGYMIINDEYRFSGELTHHNRFGYQFTAVELINLEAENVDNPIAKRRILNKLFTTGQVESMYAALEDPYEVLKNQDHIALMKVKGCQLKTAVSWINRFSNFIPQTSLYLELEQYNLSDNLLTRLKEAYGTNAMVIQRIKENPYCICEVAGIGWKTADKIALAGGMSRFSLKRIETFIQTYLYQRGNEGYSYVAPGELMSAILENLGEDVPDFTISEAIHDMEERLYWNEAKTIIGLRYFWNLENDIADEVIRILKAPSEFKKYDYSDLIKKKELEQDWEYTDEQLQAVEMALDNNLVVITGGAGCVDCDTEFFTGTEWKRIADFQSGDSVLQYNEDGTAELVKPIAYIKQPAEYLWHFQTKYGLDQCLSDQHEVVYVSAKGKQYKKPFKEIRQCHEQGRGFHGRFFTTFKYEGKGIPLTDSVIRLCVAIFADGSFSNTVHEKNVTYNKVRFHLKKQRKKERLEALLEECNIPYDVRKSSAEGYDDYYCYSPIGRQKHFPKEWYQATQEQLFVIMDEVPYWDGRAEDYNGYSTTCKEDADFVQFVYTANGFRATINVEDRVGQAHKHKPQYIRKSIEYTVNHTNRNIIGLGTKKDDRHFKTPIEQYKTKDGCEYCFTVPSHMLVLRRNNKIFITGNCGKSSTVGLILDILGNKYQVAQTALSGRAAARLSEVTNRTGSTIHRLLGADGSGHFKFDEETQLPEDVIIVDEISMLGGKLFYHLMSAIKTGAKVILLGDVGQLEAIGECNLAHDLLRCPSIPQIMLTKCHRQALKSAIVTESLKVRQGTPIIEANWSGTVTLGELQDLTLDCYSDAGNTYHKILQHFIRCLKEESDIMNIQVLSPMKTRGDASNYQLNVALQAIYHDQRSAVVGPKEDTTKYSEDKSKDSDTPQEIIVGTRSDCVYSIKVGDKVINVQNNYGVELVDFGTDEDAPKQVTNVYNGNIGIVLAVDAKRRSIIVDFREVGVVKIDKDGLKNIELAYAVSIHKYQGSECENVIIGIDFSAYTLLSRELVYTAITRAKKKCILVAQNKALRYAIQTPATSYKQTYLTEILNDKLLPKKEFKF